MKKQEIAKPISPTTIRIKVLSSIALYFYTLDMIISIMRTVKAVIPSRMIIEKTYINRDVTACRIVMMPVTAMFFNLTSTPFIAPLQ